MCRHTSLPRWSRQTPEGRGGARKVFATIGGDTPRRTYIFNMLKDFDDNPISVPDARCLNCYALLDDSAEAYCMVADGEMVCWHKTRRECARRR